MNNGRARLRITKPDAMLDLSFALNARRTGPADVTGPDYQIDLLALGADTSGKIGLLGMESPLKVKGHALLTHQIGGQEGG